MEKKEISVRTSVKAIITGFVAYGIILLFLCLLASLFSGAIINSIENINKPLIFTIITVIETIILFFLIRTLCKLSTFDVFKKCTTNPENVDPISKKLTVFFIICAIFFVFVSIFFSIIRNNNEYKSIEIVKMQYSQVFSDDFTEQLTNNILKEFEQEKQISLISTIIVDLGLVISFISLIPYQKEILKKYTNV